MMLSADDGRGRKNKILTLIDYVVRGRVLVVPGLDRFTAMRNNLLDFRVRDIAPGTGASTWLRIGGLICASEKAVWSCATLFGHLEGSSVTRLTHHYLVRMHTCFGNC